MAGCHLEGDPGAAVIDTLVDFVLYDIRDCIGAQDGNNLVWKPWNVDRMKPLFKSRGLFGHSLKLVVYPVEGSYVIVPRLLEFWYFMEQLEGRLFLFPL